MSLRDPDARRALRSVVQAVAAIVSLGLLAWLIHLLRPNAAALENIAWGLLAILFVRELLYGSENVTRAVRFKAGATGIEGEIGDAVDAVADAAADRAGEIKGNV